VSAEQDDKMRARRSAGRRGGFHHELSRRANR
jgi:hypothetical protein